jgi:predicted transcriptional regulator
MLQDRVAGAPGIGLRELARSTGIPVSSVIHHVTILKRQRRLAEARSGRRSILLPAGAGPLDGLRAAAERDARLRLLLDWVAANPGCLQRDALAAMEGLGWSRSTTQHRLRRLVGDGLLACLPKGGRRIYLPAGHTRPTFALGDSRDLPACAAQPAPPDRPAPALSNAPMDVTQ